MEDKQEYKCDICGQKFTDEDFKGYDEARRYADEYTTLCKDCCDHNVKLLKDEDTDEEYWGWDYDRLFTDAASSIHNKHMHYDIVKTVYLNVNDKPRAYVRNSIAEVASQLKALNVEEALWGIDSLEEHSSVSQDKAQSTRVDKFKVFIMQAKKYKVLVNNINGFNEGFAIDEAGEELGIAFPDVEFGEKLPVELSELDDNIECKNEEFVLFFVFE